MDRHVSGYTVNVGIGDENRAQIAAINSEITKTFGSAIFEQPGAALHITVMDWISALAHYDEDPDALFHDAFPELDGVLTTALGSSRAFDIEFSAIKASPSAIYIEGHDAGRLKYIRDYFSAHATVPLNTSRPPEIVHCTIARFRSQVRVREVLSLIGALDCHLIQEVSTVRLIHEVQAPMLNYEVLKRYRLPS